MLSIFKIYSAFSFPFCTTLVVHFPLCDVCISQLSLETCLNSWPHSVFSYLHWCYSAMAIKFICWMFFRMSALHDLSARYLKKLCQTFQVFANIVMFSSKQDPNAGYPAGRLRNQKASLYNMLLPVNKLAGNKTWQHRLRGKKLNKILKMQTSVAEETKHEAWGEWSRKTMLGPWQISMLPKYSWC